jgi:hypothetical protein
VLFEVRRCQFSALVEAGKQQEALAFARKQLTPIAGGDAELMQEVRIIRASQRTLSTSDRNFYNKCAWAQVCCVLH